jgi:RNA polymerase sigma factor (sigma-70 family)
MSPKESEIISDTYKKESKRLLGFIRNRIPGKVEAEDILQDVFYQLTVGFNDIRRMESLTAWLYRVAENRITDLYRKKRTLTSGFKDNIAEDEQGPLKLEEILPAATVDPDDEELNDLIWEVIEETLAELPEEQRIVFVENEFEEKTFKEISEKSGIGINTLISRKRYAVLALRIKLDGLYKLLKNK